MSIRQNWILDDPGMMAWDHPSTPGPGEDYEGGEFFVQPGKKDVGRQYCQECREETPLEYVQ